MTRSNVNYVHDFLKNIFMHVINLITQRKDESKEKKKLRAILGFQNPVICQKYSLKEHIFFLGLTEKKKKKSWGQEAGRKMVSKHTIFPSGLITE